MTKMLTERFVIMEDSIISTGQIFLQEIIWEEVSKAKKTDDDVTIYNRVCKQVDVVSLEMLKEIMRLIHLNQSIINYGG